MINLKKYLWWWAVVGALVPILLAVVSLFMPPPPEWNPFEERHLSPTQQIIGAVATCMFPAIYVQEVLSLVVTDAGGDSGAGITGALLFALAVCLNAGVYALVGFVIWSIAATFGSLYKRPGRKSEPN